MANQEASREELEHLVQELCERLEVAEETLQAITRGEVDALVVSGLEGEEVFTLQSADYPYRRFVEEMKEGAATVNSDGMILYCNHRLMSWLKHPLEKIIGSELKQYIVPRDQPMLQSLLGQGKSGVGKTELSLIATDGTEIPVQISISSLTMNDVTISGLIVTNLTEQKQNEKIIAAQTAQLIEANTQLQNELLERQRAEHALQESKQQLELALEGSGDGFWDWDIVTGQVYYNPRYVQMLGYELDEFPTEVDGWAKLIHPDDRQRVMEILDAHFKDSSVPYSFDYRLLTKSGEWKWIADYGKIVVRDQDGKPLRMTGTHKDISDRKLAEDVIKASLKEKEVLLKEIHHRVKNNLQIVSSLLQLQSRRTQEKQAAEVLQDSQNRISSIALVHEKLYRSEDLANIDFGQYIPDLINHLFDTYKVKRNAVTLRTKVDKILLEIDTAIPCGLIVNELVSNSLKYAFPKNHKGKIQIEFYANNDETLTLIVRDNGIGIPEKLDIETTSSLGLTLVQGLVDQLEGTLELNRSQGTEFRITFPNS